MAILALSSGESELAAVVKGAGEGLGFQSSLADFGLTLPLEIHSDATAAIGISSRRRSGHSSHGYFVALGTRAREERRRHLGESAKLH